jgi:hypothetical protein
MRLSTKEKEALIRILEESELIVCMLKNGGKGALGQDIVNYIISCIKLGEEHGIKH